MFKYVTQNVELNAPIFSGFLREELSQAENMFVTNKIAFLYNHTFFISSIYTFASIFTILHLHNDAVPSHHVTLADLRLVSIQMIAGSSAHL